MEKTVLLSITSKRRKESGTIGSVKGKKASFARRLSLPALSAKSQSS
jgi:hypothetical protein